MKKSLKIYSLRKEKDIENAHKGKSFFTKEFILKIQLNDLNKVRFLIIVSNKVSKSAVIRNKIRRIVREEIRKNLMNIKKGVDIILIISKNSIQPNGKTINTESLYKSINYSFKKSGLL